MYSIYTQISFKYQKSALKHFFFVFLIPTRMKLNNQCYFIRCNQHIFTPYSIIILFLNLFHFCCTQNVLRTINHLIILTFIYTSSNLYSSYPKRWQQNMFYLHILIYFKPHQSKYNNYTLFTRNMFRKKRHPFKDTQIQNYFL